MVTHPTWPEDESIWQQPDDERALAMWALHTDYNRNATARYLQMGLNMDEMYPSKWLRASDLKGKRVTVSIGRVEIEQFQDGTSKPAVYFPGKDKALILNKTNATAISSAYGPDTDGWLGKNIELFSMKVQGPSGLVDGLRVSIPESVAERQPVAAEAAEAELDDDIPF